MPHFLLTFDSNQIETNGQRHSTPLIRLSYQVLSLRNVGPRDRKLGQFVGFWSQEALEWVMRYESSRFVWHMTSFELLIVLSNTLAVYDSVWRHNRYKTQLPVFQVAISRVSDGFIVCKTDVCHQCDKGFLTRYLSTKSVKVAFFANLAWKWLFMAVFDPKFQIVRTKRKIF